MLILTVIDIPDSKQLAGVDVRLARRECCLCLAPILGDQNLLPVLLQKLLERLGRFRVIFNDEYQMGDQSSAAHG